MLVLLLFITFLGISEIFRYISISFQRYFVCFKIFEKVCKGELSVLEYQCSKEQKEKVKEYAMFKDDFHTLAFDNFENVDATKLSETEGGNGIHLFNPFAWLFNGFSNGGGGGGGGAF